MSIEKREKLDDGRILCQTIYDHGGSRIWFETPEGSRHLLLDTYSAIKADMFEVIKRMPSEAIRARDTKDSADD